MENNIEDIRVEKLKNDLKLIVHLMSYIAEDLKDISCMDSLVVFDQDLNPLFYEDKENLKNTVQSRALIASYLKEHKDLRRCFKEVLRTGEHQKIREEGNKMFLALPIEGIIKPIGIVGVTYMSDGCYQDDCTTDQIFREMVNLFIKKYRELKEKEVMTSMASLTCSLKTLEDYERFAILKTGNRCNWNITVMAKELEIGRNTLYNKMKSMGIN